MKYILAPLCLSTRTSPGARWAACVAWLSREQVRVNQTTAARVDGLLAAEAVVEDPSSCPCGENCLRWGQGEGFHNKWRSRRSGIGE